MHILIRQSNIFQKVCLSLIILFASISEANNKLPIQESEIQESTIQDFGVRGNVFDIKEVSILEEIMQKLEMAKKDGTLEQLQTAFNEKVKARVLRPLPVKNIKKAIVDRSWTYNPSYTQETDIFDDQGRVIIAAGTTVNALETLKWGEPLVFIDGEDQDQIKWASIRSGRIVLTNGAPLSVADQLKRPVYFDQGGIFCKKFKIEAVPAIIEQDHKLLKISEVKL